MIVSELVGNNLDDVFFLTNNKSIWTLQGNSNISGSAHLGGAAVAAIAWARIRRGRFRY